MIVIKKEEKKTEIVYLNSKHKKIQWYIMMRIYLKRE